MSTSLKPFGFIQPNPITVEAGFSKFLAKIRTTSSQTSSAASHRRSIESVLESAFSMSAFFRTGSFGSGVNVAGYSDVDYFAVIPASNLKQNSAATLDEVASVLRDRFPLTGVRVDAPGIRVPFGPDGTESTEIVPVDATGFTKLGFRQFDMPDGNGGWMFAAPESHKAYVDGADQLHSGSVKPLIRLVKAWNFMKNVGIKSFYLEVWVTKYALEEKSIVYDIDFSRIMAGLLVGGLRDLPDPRFPYDNFTIKACKTEVQRLEAIKKLLASCQWSQQAVQNRLNGSIREAYDRWSLVFNHDFPAYNGLF